MPRLIFQCFTYYLIRMLLFPFTLLSYKQLHRLAKAVTPLLFPLLKRYRKRALSNLTLAKDLNLSSQEVLALAKKSLMHLLITALEYSKLEKEPHIEKLAYCVNPEIAKRFIEEKKGAIFFCAHLANWELLFLEGTMRMPGVAIGKSVKNPFLYRWILRIRQRFGGTIIPPKNALKESLKALKKGIFVGIVGDQGMPDSGFSSPFLGRLAWTSPLPALLACRTGAPLFFASTKREDGTYLIEYSDPLFADPEKPLEEEVPRLMRHCLALLEKSIKKAPAEWMWQHNKWKQKLPGDIKKPFREDALAIILPEDAEVWIERLPSFRYIYKNEWILLIAPKNIEKKISLLWDEVYFYHNEKEMLLPHFGPKIVFDFSLNPKIKKHFLNLAAFYVFTLEDLEKEAPGKELKDFTRFLIEATGYAK